MLSTSKARHAFPPRFVVLLVGVIFLLSLLFVGNFNNQKNDSITEKAKTEYDVNTTAQRLREILRGTVDEIAYYHCAARTANGGAANLVLLHGSAFTKEDWKTSGILDDFCVSHFPRLSVTALDLPVQATHEDLMRVLTNLQQEGLVTLPVALITPSASGNTITDWITADDDGADNVLESLPLYVWRWIPVATGSVNKLTDGQVSKLNKLAGFGIFAIYGDGDKTGKKTSGRLQSLAEAQVLELKGGHPCYLDSPKEFVAAVLQEMGQAKG